MREIKFRIWYKNEGFMYFNSLKDITEIGWDYADNYPWNTSQQYTGHKDAEGVEIYEGDIVMYDGDKCVVEYRDGFCMVSEDKKVDRLLYCNCFWAEVIGNIYEGEKETCNVK